MKIKTTPIGDEDVRKELQIVQGNPFAYNDVSESTQRGPLKPKLLTALLGGNDKTHTTKSFVYDEETDTAQLPSGKSYSEFGKDLKKDAAKQKTFAIGSNGLRLNIAPEDYSGRRIPGTNDLMDEAYLLAKMTAKADTAWVLDDELGFAQLLTLDTNRVNGGPFAEYNYYTDITGGARPAKVDMDLQTEATDHIKLQRAEKKALLEEVGRAGESVTAIIEICGDTYFNDRLVIERKESLARDLKGTIDLASMEVNMSAFGSSTFMYDWFKGDQDGIIYINYGAEIINGTKLIADTDAYMIPVGASMFMSREYAPAQTRSYVNTEALKRYSWSREDEFQGVTMWQEENKLFLNKNPRLIRALKNTA